MPELPEVETVRRGLIPIVEGARIVRAEQRREDLRFPIPERFAERLAERTIVALGRRAKYLLFELDNGTTIIAHLGMSGSWRIERGDHVDMAGSFHLPRSKDQAHDHIVLWLQMKDGHIARIVYNDPRRFGFMTFAETGALEANRFIAGLGTEPTGNALSGPLLAELFKDKVAPLKAALLDQRLIAGLGNIYVCETLWRAGLSPRRRAGTIARQSKKAEKHVAELAESIRSVIRDAIEAGGSSLRDYMNAEGELGYFQHSFSVYDREGKACLRAQCGGTIRRIVQSGRSTFYCPRCQL